MSTTSSLLGLRVLQSFFDWAAGAARQFEVWRSLMSAQGDNARQKQAGSRVAPSERESAEAADQIYIEATLAGDEEAFASLVRRYQGALAQFHWRCTRNAADCEELVQQTFVEAYLALRKYRGDGAFLGWLRKIAARVAYRHWKQREASAKQRSLNDLGVDEHPATNSADDHSSRANDLWQCLARLRPRDRLVLTLLYLDETGIAEAARLTGWSQTMVKVQAHRARQRLLKLWQQT